MNCDRRHGMSLPPLNVEMVDVSACTEHWLKKASVSGMVRNMHSLSCALMCMSLLARRYYQPHRVVKQIIGCQHQIQYTMLAHRHSNMFTLFTRRAVASKTNS